MPRKHHNTSKRKVVYWLRRHADKLAKILKQLEEKKDV